MPINNTKVTTNKVELKVSQECYNEIASAMNASGQQITPGSEIVLSKDIMIKNPLDLRMISIRKDATDIASRLVGDNSKNLLELSDQVTKFIVFGTLPASKEATKGWK